MCEQINTENRENSGKMDNRYADHGSPDVMHLTMEKMRKSSITQKPYMVQNEARKRIDAALGLLKLRSLKK